MALTAEALVGYVLVVLVLGSLCMLPGSMGSLAARLTSLVTPVVARRLLDLLVGGALLAQAALATAPGDPSGRGWSAAHLASTASSSFSGSAVGPVTPDDPVPTGLGPGWPGSSVDTLGPNAARPNPRRSAVPLPPWLGGGPSNATPGGREATGDARAPGHHEEGGGAGAPRNGRGAAGPGAPGRRDERTGTRAPGRGDRIGGTRARRHGDQTGGAGAPGHHDSRGGTGAPGRGEEAGGAAVAEHVVEAGDTLWDIAAARLVPAERSAANINRYWRQIYGVNRSVIGGDPDLIHPGTRLRVPPFRRARR